MALNRLCDSTFGLDPKILLLGILDGMDLGGYVKLLIIFPTFYACLLPYFSFMACHTWQSITDIQVNLCEWELSREVKFDKIWFGWRDFWGSG